MNTTKLTREEVLRRWSASKETKRKMVEKLETLVRNSCLERGDLENLKQYMMEKVIVDVAWCDRNYGGSLSNNLYYVFQRHISNIPTKKGESFTYDAPSLLNQTHN